MTQHDPNDNALLFEDFVRTFSEVQDLAHQNAVEKGFWESKRNKGELIALMHSELSEALEAIRDGNPPSVKVKGFSMLEEELADVVIRIMDMAGGFDLDVAGALHAKFAHNLARPYKHGRQF